MSYKKIIFLTVTIGIIIFLIPYCIPIILALLTAILLEPAIQVGIRSLKIKRQLSVTIVFILFLLIFGLSGYWIITTLVVQLLDVTKNFPDYYYLFADEAQELFKHFQGYYIQIPNEYLSTIQQGIESLKDFVLGLATSITKNLFDFIASIPLILVHTIIYLVAMFLFCLDLPKIKIRVLSIFSDSSREKIDLVVSQLLKAFIGFFKAQIIFCFITFVLSFVGLLILKVEYALVLSLCVVLVDILPILGAGSFLVPWAIYNFVFGSTHLGIGLIILFVVITIVRRVIEPKILGASIGISALSALISMYIGFELIGFIGLIIGPALIIILQALYQAGFIKIGKLNKI
ncbi:sporulation integral membrane protein YtvI [Metabacillus halosaccharovorans]|uniref:Sporulation integral membrane protein YtvI n=1 Tax=Metabacillus halosaccharovorans TaxID=930124 RepID=A0ABT3DEC8_9BACI|nr:sporulation integral membrane protein YtvI [Metabacillus halosaccharovorans]MCV9885420.1 sporulation integral membrane protein YtvI [Metabacillus halosaccharovorans]